MEVHRHQYCGEKMNNLVKNDLKVKFECIALVRNVPTSK